MGDIADAMINGDMDCVTGEWLGDGAGYPRTMEPDHPNSINKRNNTVYKYSSKVNGIKKFLKMNLALDSDEYYNYCVDYIISEVDSEFDKDSGWEAVGEVIQEDFSKFSKYVKVR